MNAKAALLLTNGEFLIWLAVFGAALHARLHRQFPAVLSFVGIKVLVTGAYSCLTLYYTSNTANSHLAYSIFFYFYWAAYFLGTLAVFFSIEQIIRQVLTPLPGLSKLGVIIFRFTGVLTLFIALTAHLTEMRSLSFEVWIQALYVSFALCMCVFEVTLMALLIATAQRLGLSFRTRIFGLSLGFCSLGLVDFVTLLIQGSNSSQWAGLGTTNEVVIFATLIVWGGYFLAPDQRRGPLALNEKSTLMRWNEIVSQLGSSSQAQPALAPSFMSDVEELVAKALAGLPQRP